MLINFVFSEIKEYALQIAKVSIQKYKIYTKLKKLLFPSFSLTKDLYFERLVTFLIPHKDRMSILTFIIPASLWCISAR